MAIADFFKKRNQEEFRPRELPLLRAKERESKKVKETKGSSKWVFGLLTASIFLSLVFWLWGSFSRGDLIKRGARSPASVSWPSPTPTLIPKKTEEIREKIKALTAPLKGTYGVFVFNLTTKESYGLSQDEVFTAASLIKLPVILTLYQEVEEGSLSLETKYTLWQEDKRSGSGSLVGKPVGTVYTYQKLAELMGQQSDNTAFAALTRILGEKKIQTTIDSLGMSKTSFTRNETTPTDIGLFFRKLYGGSVITREHRDEILEFLTNTIYEDRIPAGVPEGTRVAHKIGTELGVFSDSGVVFASRPFVLVIMSKNALEKEAKTALVEITKAVWEFENK